MKPPHLPIKKQNKTNHQKKMAFFVLPSSSLIAYSTLGLPAASTWQNQYSLFSLIPWHLQPLLVLVYFAHSFIAVVLQSERDKWNHTQPPILSLIQNLFNVELVVMRSSKLDWFLPPLINTVKNLFMKHKIKHFLKIMLCWQCKLLSPGCQF